MTTATITPKKISDDIENYEWHRRAFLMRHYGKANYVPNPDLTFRSGFGTDSFIDKIINWFKAIKRL